MDLESLFAQFLKEKRFLSNVSPRTIKYFEWTFNIWRKRIREFPTKQNIKEFVIQLQESGISAATTNSYIRGINSFLSWLHENEYTTERLRMKPIKEPQKVLKVFDDKQLKALLSFKPQTFYQHRLYALLCLLIDTGMRINEALTLTRGNIDMDNLIVKVSGKGDKERIIPISLECRKVLYKFLKRHDFNLVFGTRQGEKLIYRNILREFKVLCKKLGINDVRTSWHTLRHGYALNHIREGGDVFSLQRILGHSDLSVTKRYVGLTENDLKLVHKKTSILGRLK